MKKLNVLMGALTLLMGTAMTSCLDSADTNVDWGQTLAKVSNSFYGGTYFTTNDGRTVTPTTESMMQMESNNGLDFSNRSNELVYIYYQWNTDQLTIPDNATDIDGVTLIGVEFLDSPVEIVYTEGAANDSIENTPIRSLGVSDSYTTIEPAFYDQTTLILPIDYYVETYQHSFTLVYYPERENNGTLTFYLRHNKQRDNPSTGSSQSAVIATYAGVSIFWRAFDLSEAMRVYNNRNGLPETSYPSQVIIKAKESDYTVNVDDTQVEEKEYTITYSPTSSTNLSTINR